MRNKTKKDVLRLSILIGIIFYIGCLISGYSKSEETIILAAENAPVPSISPSLSRLDEPAGQDAGNMEKLIRDVFKEDADKALLLLKGRGKGTCSENKTLDPKAVNRNGNGSTDFGLFQINDHWNGFKQPKRNDQMLFDPEINVRIAYRLFIDSGKSFKLWTCGKEYGI